MRTALVVSVTAAFLVACGSSAQQAATSSSTGSGPPPASTGTGTTSITTPAPSTTTTSTSTTPASSSTLCRASGLELSFLGEQDATGHGVLGFGLRNSGSHSCHTFGYPGIQFLNTAAAPLPTVSTRTTSDFFGQAPEQLLVLGPGQSASFRVGVTHSGAGGSDAGCTEAHALAVIPPDDTSRLTVALKGGAYECGTATVSPLRPGSSAYP